MKLLDNFLNAITMYKLVLYSLRVLVAISLILSFFGLISYTPLQIVISFLLFVTVCLVTNFIFAKLFRAATNTESYAITGLILFFICSPLTSFGDILPSVLAGVLAMASKYIFAIKKKHLFNPAAIAAFILGLLGFGNVSWWVGSGALLPFTLIMAFLIIKKIRRFSLFLTFLAVAVITIMFVSLVFNHAVFSQIITEMFVSWPLIFFGGVMLTEPLTTPPTRKLQMMYAAIIGVVFGAQFQFGPLYATPEFALIVGNIFSYLVSPKYRLVLQLHTKTKLASNVYEFAFVTKDKLAFRAGQYFEWTLAHPHPDFRGNRRYFTIASSPTEDYIRLGVHIEDKSSSFKKKLVALQKGDEIVASQLSGEFVLPLNYRKKIVFIAGGIGITPFRSMVQSLHDAQQKRTIQLIYSVPTTEELAYKDYFDKEASAGNIKVTYVLTDKDLAPKNWTGHVGRLDTAALTQIVPDFVERIFYLSGPNAMVEGYKKLLLENGVKKSNIKTDYFPGF